MKRNMNPENRKDGIHDDQHFMEDSRIIERIVSLALLRPGDFVLEIGPGTGNLTKHLLAKGVKVTAVEKDRRFETALKREFGENRNLNLIFGNVLKEIENVKFNKIVSNLPYSICEPLINKLTRIEFELAVLSVPESFARIVTARPKEKNYSKLSVKSQSFFDMKIKFNIPRSAFLPQPKTESVVVVLKRLSERTYGEHPEKYVLREIFLQPKKKLKNALMEGLINFNKNFLGKKFTKRLARKTIKKMELKGETLDKKVKELSITDLKSVLKNLTSLS